MRCRASCGCRHRPWRSRRSFRTWMRWRQSHTPVPDSCNVL
jgi:hypothetical protein